MSPKSKSATGSYERRLWIAGLLLTIAAGALVIGECTGGAGTSASSSTGSTTTLPPPTQSPTTQAPTTSTPSSSTSSTAVTTTAPPPTTIPNAPTGRISTPAAESVVRMEQILSGTVAGIPAGNKVWIVVQIGVFYPQDGPLNVLPDGRWTGTAFIGATTDTDKTFVLHIVHTGPTGTTQFGDYLRRGRGFGDFPGIFQEDLAPDVTILDSITVRRG